MTEREHGGTEATTEEAAALLPILFADRIGDKVRVMRAYGDAWCAALVAVLTEARDWIDKHKCCTEERKALIERIDAARSAA